MFYKASRIKNGRKHSRNTATRAELRVARRRGGGAGGGWGCGCGGQPYFFFKTEKEILWRMVA